MWEEILRAVPVYFSSMLKFILGPIGGYASGLHLITTIIVTIGGMMTVVLAFVYSGNWFRAHVLNRFLSKKQRSGDPSKLGGIWKKYGLAGVAALTPIILTPIGGTLLALSSGSGKEKIIFYMFISASFWAIVFSGAIYFFGKEVLPDFIK